jgi:hypothetical protein
MFPSHDPRFVCSLTIRRFEELLFSGLKSLWSTSRPSPLDTLPDRSICLRALLRAARRFFLTFCTVVIIIFFFVITISHTLSLQVSTMKKGLQNSWVSQNITGELIKL